MRVISGKYKGRKLVSPHGEVRPTTDMVKGSVFSVLTSRGAISGAKCLDVFCGSGGMGIEALSRGADECVFVDADTSNASENLKRIGLDCRLVRGDFRKSLRLLRGEKFDLIFCDPPYKSGFAEIALGLMFKYDLLGENGIVIVEHSTENDLIFQAENCIMEKRTFGVTTFEIITRGDNASNIRGNV